MTAGVPGAGIGGMFYLLMALLAPVWTAVGALTGRQPGRARWALALRHSLLSAAILAAIWLTGWGLGLLLVSKSAASVLPGMPSEAISARVLGVAMVYIALSTLAAVLVGVELLRLLVRRRRPSALLVAAMLLMPAAAGAQGTTGRRTAEMAALVSRADAAYERGDKSGAEQAYDQVLLIDPDHSRALFRKATLLSARDLSAAAGYYRHYSAVEPNDAWGHLAVADAEARLGHRAAAETAYAKATRLAPSEPDVVLGAPRMYVALGATGQAIRLYEAWLAAHPKDADVWLELATAYDRARWWPLAVTALERAIALRPDDPRLVQRLANARRRAAPALIAGLLAVGETDISTWGPAVAAEVGAGDRARVGGFFRQRRLTSFGETGTSDRLGGSFAARPVPEVQIDAGFGGVWLRPDGADHMVKPELSARVRRIAGLANGPGVDVRATHGPLDLTPELIGDPVTSSLVSGTVDVPVGTTLRLRGLGRIGWLNRREEHNVRSGIGGGGAVRIADGARVTGQWQQIRNSLPTATGYFAPERAELIDGGVEFEREFDAVSVAIDAGAGVQRVQKGGEPMGGWARALRAWGFVAWSVAPGRQLLVEFEAYDSQVATIVQTAENWRHASVTVSFRTALIR